MAGIALVIVVARGNIFSSQTKEVLVAGEGKRCAFRVYTSTKLKTVMEKLADVWKVPSELLSFSYRGTSLLPTDTFESLKIKGPDFITVGNTFTLIEPLEYPLSSLSQDFQKLFNNRQMGTDFIFKLAGNKTTLEDKTETMDLETDITEYQEVHVHKWLLSCRSEKFNALFNSSMEENKSGSMIIENHSSKIVMVMLQYLYTDQVSSTTITTLDDIISLLVLADEYLLPQLKRICEIKLIEKIDEDNIIRLFNVCNLYHTKGLKHRCDLFFTENHQNLQKKYDMSILFPIAQEVLRG